MEKDASVNENTAVNSADKDALMQKSSRIKTAAMLSRIGLILSIVGIGLIFSICGIVCGLVCSKAGEPLGKTAVALGVAGAVLSVIFGGMIAVCAFILF